jgi:hypothetical protein
MMQRNNVSHIPLFSESAVMDSFLLLTLWQSALNSSYYNPFKNIYCVDFKINYKIQFAVSIAIPWGNTVEGPGFT